MSLRWIFPEFFEDEMTDEAFVREDLASDWEGARAYYLEQVGLDGRDYPYTEATSGPLCAMRFGTATDDPPPHLEEDQDFFIKCSGDEAEVRYWWLIP
jgi:hypothetical protein